MRILVTGGNGFIGSHLVQALHKDGAEVRILDPVQRKGLPPGVSVLSHTVTNYDACLRAMNGVHLVYHLAARHAFSDTPQYPARVFSNNTRGTVEILTAARQTGVQKVIFASSWEVYGNVQPNAEDMPCYPVTVVGASKYAAEVLCRQFVYMGLEVVVLRLFEVWGDGGYSAVEQFKDGEGVIEGDGEQTRDFVHVSDVVAALKAAYRWDAGCYNVGTGVETSLMGLWRLMRKDAEPTFMPPREDIVMQSVADLTKVGQLWQAKRPLEVLQ